MEEFVVKYWLEVVFGLVCAAIAFVARHYVKLIKKEKKAHEDEIIDTLNTKMDEQKESVRTEMNECSNRLMQIVAEKNQELLEADKQIHKEIDEIRDGVLAVQGRTFKEDCERLLQENHVITIKEYEQILADHIVYNELGGNHEGDALFKMVEAKYSNTVGKAEVD